MIRGILRLGLFSMLTLFALVATSFASIDGATGRFCGTARCVPIPAPLAVSLSQRNESFEPAFAPRPAPFYRIRIKATGEGYIGRTIIWVPSRKLGLDQAVHEAGAPRLLAHRERERADCPWLRRLARMVKPFPAPAHWARVLPK